MAHTPLTARGKRYVDKLSADNRAVVPTKRTTRASRAQTLHQIPPPAIGLTVNAGLQPPVSRSPKIEILAERPILSTDPGRDSFSSSSNFSDYSNSSSNAASDGSNLPWSPANNRPVPSINLLAGFQSQANTDITIQLPWPARVCFKWNFLRLYGSLITAENEGLEPDYFTGRVYGYIDREDVNTASTAARLQTFFRLNTLLHLYRLFTVFNILYRILLTLLRYHLMQWGFFPLFEYDFIARWWLEALVLGLGYWVFKFWPLNLFGHVCRLIAAFLVQAAVWSYFQEQEELRELIFKLHPVVWVAADILWTVLHQHSALPIPSASAMWFIAGLDINPIFLFTKLYPIAVHASARWKYCGNFGMGVQGLCFLTPAADFPVLLESIQDPMTVSQTIIKQPTITEVIARYFPITTPIVVSETETKTVYKGPITGEPGLCPDLTNQTTTKSILPPYLNERIRSMAYVKAIITTMVRSITRTFSGRSDEAAAALVPDSTYPLKYTGSATIPSPEHCGL